MVKGMNSQYYGGAIWTNHALQRLDERGLSQKMAWETFKYPDRSFAGKKAGTTEFHKRYEKSRITIIAKPNEQNEWLILSCWIDPPLPGTVDHKRKQDYHNYQRAGFWGKLWYHVKQQVFGR